MHFCAKIWLFCLHAVEAVPSGVKQSLMPLTSASVALTLSLLSVAVTAFLPSDLSSKAIAALTIQNSPESE